MRRAIGGNLSYKLRDIALAHTIEQRERRQQENLSRLKEARERQKLERERRLERHKLSGKNGEG